MLLSSVFNFYLPTGISRNALQFYQVKTFSFLQKKIFNSHFTISLNWCHPTPAGPLKGLKWFFLKHRLKPYMKQRISNAGEAQFSRRVDQKWVFSKAQVKLGSGSACSLLTG